MNHATATLAAAREELDALVRVPVAIVIETQVRENYGAHDWDGEGECPQYWKSKGGYTYVIEGFEAYREDISDENLHQIAGDAFLRALTAIEKDNEMFTERAICAIVREAGGDDSYRLNPWETVTVMTATPDGFDCRETIVQDDEYFRLRPGVAKIERTWKLDAEGNRSDFNEEVTYR